VDVKCVGSAGVVEGVEFSPATGSKLGDSLTKRLLWWFPRSSMSCRGRVGDGEVSLSDVLWWFVS
jgi:hypothetical protein